MGGRHPFGIEDVSPALMRGGGGRVENRAALASPLSLPPGGTFRHKRPSPGTLQRQPAPPRSPGKHLCGLSGQMCGRSAHLFSGYFSNTGAENTCAELPHTCFFPPHTCAEVPHTCKVPLRLPSPRNTPVRKFRTPVRFSRTPARKFRTSAFRPGDHFLTRPNAA